MSGCVMNGKPIPDLAAEFLTKRVGQGLALVRVEIVHDQVNRRGGRVLHCYFAGEPRELKGGSIRGGEVKWLPALGSTAQKTLAVPRRSYSLSRRASLPGTAGDGGRTSACNVTGFSSRHTTGS